MDAQGIVSGGLGEASGIFVGRFDHLLDPKRRLTIPAEWRENTGLPASLYVLPSLQKNRCLSVYPAREMVRKLNSLRSLSIADDSGRQFARLLGSRSQLVPWDSAGRIRIKDELLEYAQLTEQVVLIGSIQSFELWNPEVWRQVSGISDSELSEAAKQIGF